MKNLWKILFASSIEQELELDATWPDEGFTPPLASC